MLNLFLKVALLAMYLPATSFAFFDTTDRTELRAILPNETAFWILSSENNRGQARTNSIQALAENQVSLDFKKIDHYKLGGSGGTSMLSGWDYFVPVGRLIVVNRSMYSREWVIDKERGTSEHDDSIHCQDKNGLNIKVGVSIGAEIEEANAAKYLYRFGVIPPEGNPEDGKVIFTSVYNARSLVSVMDDVGRKRIQTLICHETAKRTLDETNLQANDIMDIVNKEAFEFFGNYGITITFLGWADTFTFDPEIQSAINRVYIAGKDAEAAEKLSKWIPVIQGEAEAETTRNFGLKTDGHLPTTIVGMPPAIPDMLKSLLGTYLNNALTPTSNAPATKP